MKIMTAPPGISRRQALTIAAGVAGASVTSVAAVVGTSTPAQAAKASQKIVKYQDTPKGDQRCENCVQFEAPSSCKTVEGTVAAQGWCLVLRRSQRRERRKTATITSGTGGTLLEPVLNDYYHIAM